jgi:hypothetical protein
MTEAGLPWPAMTQASVARLLRLSFNGSAQLGHTHAECVGNRPDRDPTRRRLAKLDTRQRARRNP